MAEAKPTDQKKMLHGDKVAKFHAAIESVVQAHTHDVCHVQEENHRLREQIIELREHLRQVQARIICSKIDEPKMHSLAQSVAEEVAGWIDRGEHNQAALPEEGKLEERRGTFAVGDRASKAQVVIDENASSNESALIEEIEKALADSPPDAKVLDHPRSMQDGPSSSTQDGLLSDFMPSREDTMTGRDLCEVGGDKARNHFRKKNRRSWSKILSSPEAAEARLIAQKTHEAVQQNQTPLARHLGKLKVSNRWGKSVDKTTFLSHRSGPFLQRIVAHQAFDGVCASMILFNSVLIGVSTQWTSDNIGEADPVTLMVLGHLCSLFFLAELLIRIGATGKAFFVTPESRNWNLFDLTLVAISVGELVVDLAATDSNAGTFKGLKTIKMLRILRLFRVFRFFKDLSLLALMVIDSMKSLFNALMMLMIITYVFAIIFTVQANSYRDGLKDQTPAKDCWDAGLQPEERGVCKHFGDLGRTLYALMQAMLSGISWGELTNSLLEVDWGVSFMLFSVYVFFTMLAVLNIITGVFVDNAVETARTQRDYLVQKEMELKEAYVKEMQKLFGQMDEDGSGSVSLEEVKEYFEDPNVKSYFTALGLDPQDSERLFSLLDHDGSGDVGVTEFIDGCLRLKGQARSIDIYELLLKTNRVETKLKDVADHIEQFPGGAPKSRLSNITNGSTHQNVSPAPSVH